MERAARNPGFSAFEVRLQRVERPPKIPGFAPLHPGYTALYERGRNRRDGGKIERLRLMRSAAVAISAGEWGGEMNRRYGSLDGASAVLTRNDGHHRRVGPHEIEAVLRLVENPCDDSAPPQEYRLRWSRPRLLVVAPVQTEHAQTL